MPRSRHIDTPMIGRLEPEANYGPISKALSPFPFFKPEIGHTTKFLILFHLTLWAG
jgi:hypothetical protein